MRKRVCYLILLEILIVLMLTFGWEFWFEDHTFAYLDLYHKPEVISERLECIITSSVFVFIALIVPFGIIIRDVSRRRHGVAQLHPGFLQSKVSTFPVPSAFPSGHRYIIKHEFLINQTPRYLYGV
jgi:hypothetical protein